MSADADKRSQRGSSTILGTATAVPEHCFDQDSVKRQLRPLLPVPAHRFLHRLHDSVARCPPGPGHGLSAGRAPVAHQTQPSWDVLREYGNLSSAAVLFVLERWMKQHRPRPGAYELLGALGPGLSTELCLLQWN